RFTAFAVMRLAIQIEFTAGGTLLALKALPQGDLLGLLARRLAVAVQPGLQFRDRKFVRNRGRFHQDPDLRGRTYTPERETAPLEFGNPEHERTSSTRTGCALGWHPDRRLGISWRTMDASSNTCVRG